LPFAVFASLTAVKCCVF